MQVSTLIGGRWRLERLLGQGGMSDVYRAVDETVAGDPVAVKIVRSSEPALAGRLAQEAKALAGFDHPGLVRLFESGVHNGQAFMVMELVDGPTLASRLRRGKLSPSRAATLGSALGDALSYVHERGIVHRDLKPANVLLGPGARVRLADFGIARLLDASSLTVTGSTLGTAAYMAPEQIDHHSVGTAADIWSLGMILLESITGRRVFQGTPAEVIARRLAAPLRLPTDLPAPWRLLLDAMLDPSPHNRPSASDVSQIISAKTFKQPWRPDVGAAEGVAPVVSTADPGSTALWPPPNGATLVGSERAASEGRAPSNGAAAAGAPNVDEGKTLVDHKEPTMVAPLGRGVEGGTGRRRRYVFALAFVVVLLLAAVLAAWVSTYNPTPARADGHHRQPAAKSASTATTAPTTTTTSTTAPLTVSGTAATLFGDIQQGITDGSISQSVGSALENQLDKTLSDAESPNPNPHALGSDIGNLDATIAGGASSGDVTPGEASTLTADVADLASALGAYSTTTTTAPSPATAPSPTQPGGSGPGGPGQSNGQGGQGGYGGH